MKNIKHYFKGFTLVELIIVITILAILATIAFISFQNYFWDARDANRVSTIKNIESGLSLFQIKSGMFPTPDTPKIFTGWIEGKSQINQWIIWENVTRIISLSNIPLDPKEKTPYVYSTFWKNNTYYQVWIESENTQTSLLPQVYAKSKSSIVRWNYKFDPSLPSLILVENEALTNSWIFSPDVCFVMNNWKNTINNCNETKENMTLKEYDHSLISYWDMETTFSSWEIQYLKDLSWNKNDGWIFTWVAWEIAKPIIGNWNMGLMWQSTKFYNSWTWGHIRLDPQAYRFHNAKWITIIWFVKENDFLHWHKCIWKFHKNTATYWWGSLCFNAWSYGVNWWFNTPWNVGITYSSTWALNMDFSKWNMVIWVIDYTNKKLKYYQNWILISEKYVDFPENFYTYQEWDIENRFDNIWYGTAPNPGTLDWYLDEVKIYNRALSSEEIIEQAKIAGF